MSRIKLRFPCPRSGVTDQIVSPDCHETAEVHFIKLNCNRTVKLIKSWVTCNRAKSGVRLCSLKFTRVHGKSLYAQMLRIQIPKGA